MQVDVISMAVFVWNAVVFDHTDFALPGILRYIANKLVEMQRLWSRGHELPWVTFIGVPRILQRWEFTGNGSRNSSTGRRKLSSGVQRHSPGRGSVWTCGGQSLPDAKEKYEISVQFLTFCCRNLGINEWDEYSCANSQFKKFRAFSGGGGWTP